MLKTIIFIGLFVFVNIILILIRSNSAEEDDTLGKQKNLIEMRSLQVKDFRKNALVRKFQTEVDEKVDYNKRYKVETTLMQAGYSISYAELKAIEWGLALLIAIVTFITLNNPLMSILLSVTAKILPYQAFQFVANQRMDKMQKQIGSFIQLTTERYRANGDFPKAIKQSAPDFKGQEPMYSEIQKTILDMEVGTPTDEAMVNLSRRTGNKFLKLLANYYKISATLGTEDARDRIVSQAWVQFNEDYKMKQTLKSEISGPKTEAYLMLSFVPIVIVYQIFSNEDYLPFMLNTQIGKVGSAGMLMVILCCIWFINKKIGAPLD